MRLSQIRRFAFKSSALIAALAIPMAAHASTTSFVINLVGGDTYSFSTSAAPTVASDKLAIYIDPVVTDVTTSTNEGTDTIGFFTSGAPNFGGFLDSLDSNPNVGLFDPYSIQLFVSPADPVFYNGTYKLYDTSNQSDTAIGTITITGGVNSNAPEPSSLILLGTGVLGLTGTVRRRFSK